MRSSRLRAFTVFVALAVPGLVLVPLAASGEPRAGVAAGAGDAAAPPAPSGVASDRYDPENVTAISPYMETLAKGNERFVAKDVPGAIDAYKKATVLAPKQALAYYLLGEAYLSTNSLGEADAAIAQALAANDVKNPALRARVLFLSADIAERQKKWDLAKTQWQAYAEHVAKNADAGFAPTAESRKKAIDKVLEQEKAYVDVRARIAAEKADAGRPKK